MRTRNRGQRASIVSSLGLCPRSRKTKCLRGVVRRTGASQRKHRIFQSRVKRVAEENRKRPDPKIGRRVVGRGGNKASEPAIDANHSIRCTSSKWRVSTGNILTRTGSSEVIKADSLTSHKPSARPAESPSFNTSCRGRKRQHAKVGRPRLNKPREKTKSKIHHTPVTRLRASRPTPNRGNNSDSGPPNRLKAEAPRLQHVFDISAELNKDAVADDKQVPAKSSVKRPRGRPRSCVLTKEDKRGDTNSPDTQSLLQKTNDNVCHADEHAFLVNVCSPKLIKTEDLYYADELRFGAPDDVLQGVLKEINTRGVVPKIPDHGERMNCKVEQGISPDANFIFDIPFVKDMFEDIWESSDVILNLDTKDLFLALNGLLRPGVFELWRRRLEEQSKKLSRSHMGRLRPNPRPRRYSDMFVSGGEQSNGSRHSVSDMPVYVDKIRPGSRSVAVAAARLTAAKRLIRARSRHRRGPRVVGNTCKISKKLQPIIVGSDLSSRSRRRSQKVTPGIELCSPRARRHPDVSHHIDWKFCYAQSDKPISATNQNTPKKRRKAEPSPGKFHISVPPRLEADNFDSVKNLPDVPSCMDTSAVNNHRGGSSVSGPGETDSGTQNLNSNVDGPDEYAFELKKSLVRRLDIEGSIDGRRKRRHALTVQRKRPIERPVSTFVDSEHVLWRDETVDKGDPLSDSSANSSSACDYGKSFRQTKWILPPSPKPKGNSENPPDHSKPTTHSVELPRPRHVTGSGHKRSLRNSQLNSYMSHRGRISRRPDRMCRLTLLDRLLLGLNCSVSQNDDEIHVKRLHKDELSILTQRISKTGFSVQSLSVRRNANNDAEYNIVLIFAPNTDAGIRRVRCSSLTTRTRLLGSGRPLDSDARESPFPSGKSKRNIQFAACSPELHDVPRKLMLQNNMEPIRRSPIGGYHSDTDVCCRKITHSGLRRAHSDSDLSVIRQTTYETGVMGKCTIDSSSNQITSTFQPSSTEAGCEKHSPLFANGSFQSSKTWIGSSFDRIPPHPGERHYLLDSSGQKRGLGLTRMISERQAYDNEVHHVAAISTPHGISKRSLCMETHGTNHGAPFRRHSPRKVIRKVYTGSSTIPKILNRKRPTGSPNVSISVSTGSAQPTSSLLASLPHAVPASANACSTVNSLATPTSNASISSPAASIIFDEPASTLPVCPATSVAGFSLQYRRIPAPVMPVAVMPPSGKLVDHPANMATAASSPAPTFIDNRPPGMLRFRPVSTVPLGSNISTKIPERLHSAEMSTVVSRSPSGILPPNMADKLGCDTSATEEKVNSNANNGEQTAMDTITSEQMDHEVPCESKPSEGLGSKPTVLHPSVPEKSSVSPPDGNTELGNSENEIPSDWDGSYTPATSMSASQLLKLKRLHDEAGRVVGSPGETRATLPAGCLPLSGSAQSSQASSMQGKQAQSIHTEAYEATRTGKSCQPESRGIEFTQQQQQQQQGCQQQPLSSQPQRTNTPARHPFTPVMCPATSSGVISEHLMVDASKDSDEFELRSTDHPADTIDSEETQSGQSVLLHPENVLPGITSVASAPSDSMQLPVLGGGISRLQRFPWSIVRPPTVSTPVAGPAALPSTTTPRFHPGIGMVHNSEAVTAVTSVDGVSTCHLPSHVVVQTPPSLTATVVTSTTPYSGDSASADRPHFQHSPQCYPHQQQRNLALSCNPLLFPPSVGAYDHSPQTLTLTGYSQANGIPLTGGTLKRTIVHKYHSFRKILPKSPEHISSFVSTATFHAIPSLGSSSPGLTQFPMLGPNNNAGSGTVNSGLRMYRNSSFPQSSFLSCDPAAESAFFVDIPGDFSDVTSGTNHADHSPHGFQSYIDSTTTTNTSATSTVASSMVNNPASQLLKSLLENRDNKESSGTILAISANQHHLPTAPKKGTPNANSSTGSVTWNQPAHQSRGTWQLGKRVHNTSTSSASRTSVDTAGPGHLRSGTEIRDACEAGERHSHPFADLSSSVKLTPGSKSRLQQLQQHYQRRQHLQQVQPKHQTTQPSMVSTTSPSSSLEAPSSQQPHPVHGQTK